MASTDPVLRAYYAGALQALQLYAHWNDVLQYVGSCGTRLRNAHKALCDAEDKQAPIHDMCPLPQVCRDAIANEEATP